jgi:hypothetical protein
MATLYSQRTVMNYSLAYFYAGWVILFLNSQTLFMMKKKRRSVGLRDQQKRFVSLLMEW